MSSTNRNQIKMSKSIGLKNKLLPLFLLLFVVIGVISLFVFFALMFGKGPQLEQREETNKNNHIVILGTYENRLFLEKVYEGAKKNGDFYSAVVELYVPNSKAQDKTLAELLDYASFVNADGVLAYIDSVDTHISAFTKVSGEVIPLVTTGVYSSGVEQISFIGNNYWELGNKIGTEAVKLLNGQGMAFIISSEYSSSSTYSNMTNSIQSKLRGYEGISFTVVDQNDLRDDFESILTVMRDYVQRDENILFVCMNEEDTLETAHLFTENKIFSDKHVNMIGFGTNETCQSYLNKGTITELISLDPNSIGESAINQLFEYKEKGYANSYIAADVLIQKRGAK